MIKLILKVAFTAIIIGIILTVILFFSVGDDDYWWIFLIIGLSVGVFIAYHLRNKYIHRNLAITFISLFLFIALLLITYGVYGFIFDKDMITDSSYNGMGGMLPYLTVGASLPLIFSSVTISLFIKKRELF